MDATLKLIQELTEAPGPSGYEGPVREIVRRYVTPLADEVTTDNLGSLVATKVGKKDGPRIMLAGHMDEIGFIVTMVTDDGFVKFQQVGGWWDQVLLAQRFTIRTGQGDLVGVVGSKAPHVLEDDERKKVYARKDMFIDVGATSKEEALSFGIRPGDPIIPICPFTVMKNEKFLMGKAWDDRFGVAALIQVLEGLKGHAHPNVVLAAATVQEEVGLRGATTAAQMLRPDIGFALDVGIAGDTPGMRPELAQGKLGKGPTVLLYDGSMIGHARLREFVVSVAEEEHIPFQYDHIPFGGTDAGVIHKTGAGAPSLVIGVPTRYIHSHAGIFHRDDFEGAVRLLIKVLMKLDQKTVDDIRRG